MKPEYITQKKLEVMSYQFEVSKDECERSSNPDNKQMWLLKRTMKEAMQGFYEGA